MFALKTLAAVLSLLGFYTISRQDLQDCHKAEHARRMEACTDIAETIRLDPKETRAYAG
ncbi:MAG: hypothetical protein K2Y27_06710 [Xanthobacteraceae bacterium]|nr:hypothetical protein [Xanthobacteraceae bacterium]